ncbi:UNVERIFIED_CONTAM: hypothetical protein Slati_1683700 [Sesamum latifolium]|uniref:Reverse transcriptase zinc-binding domain-containing protein n=1 Tax=Sesamum latifolium TaxID=2727402 RepID=A0AAW2WVN7_9LAMI
MRWQVGDGKSISIVGDPWLPSPLSFKLIRPPKTLPIIANGQELLQEDGKRWNEELIEAEIEEEDAVRINSIELQNPESQNALVWHFGKKGRFTVRSAYELCTQYLHGAGTSLGPAQDRESLAGWNFLWRAKVPPKVQLLAWRACQEAIPVCCNLRRKGLNIPTACMRCGNDAEDVLHVLLRCSFSRQVWALSCLPWRWINLEVRNTEDWMRGVWKELKGPDFSLFLLICRNLFISRNQLAFEAVSRSPLEVIGSARRVFHIWHKDPMITAPHYE